MAHAGHPLVGDDVYGLQVGVLGVHVCGSVCMCKAVVMCAECAVQAPSCVALFCNDCICVLQAAAGYRECQEASVAQGPGSGSALQCVS